MDKLKIIILVIIGLYIVASILLYLLQEGFIFLDEPLDDNFRFSFDTPHAEVNLDMEDGGRINVLHFTAEDPKGLILYYHGNAGNLAGWGYVAHDFVALGYDVAIMDYRGYGKSTGRRTQKTMLSDAVAVYDHFKRKYSEDKIVLYGRSLGTGIAAYVASKTKPGKLVLESPYFNFTSLVQVHFPVFPAGPSLKFKFRTNQYLRDVECPIYIFHGTEDTVVPFKQGKKLYEGLGSKEASMFVLEGGTHNNLDSYKEYWENLEAILE